MGVPTRTGYAASKHAMTGFFDSLRIELMGSGVAVTTVHPGFVATGIRATAGEDTVHDAMSVEECVRRIVRAIERRERRVVMTARGKMGPWLRLIAPGLLDRLARRAIEQGH
jgi:short-subunit dehydrogenase